MADKSKIEWTDATWNIITGCTLVDDGCRHCYAAHLITSWPAIGRLLSREVLERLRDYVGAICGTDRVLILDGGITLEVVSLRGAVT